MRLRWLFGVVHAEGGGAVGRFGEGRSFEADKVPATPASQVLVVVSEHSETRRMFVDTVHGDGAIACAVVMFRGARMRDGDRSKKIGT